MVYFWKRLRYFMKRPKMKHFAGWKPFNSNKIANETCIVRREVSCSRKANLCSTKQAFYRHFAWEFDLFCNFVLFFFVWIIIHIFSSFLSLSYPRIYELEACYRDCEGAFSAKCLAKSSGKCSFRTKIPTTAQLFSSFDGSFWQNRSFKNHISFSSKFLTTKRIRRPSVLR